MVYETDNKTQERHPVRRGKYKVHRDKPAKVVQKQTEDQVVDEAAEESFPASDPPSWSPTSVGGHDKPRNH